MWHYCNDILKNVEFGMNSPVEVFLVLFASIDDVFEMGGHNEWYPFSLYV